MQGQKETKEQKATKEKREAQGKKEKNDTHETKGKKDMDSTTEWRHVQERWETVGGTNEGEAGAKGAEEKKETKEVQVTKDKEKQQETKTKRTNTEWTQKSEDVTNEEYARFDKLFVHDFHDSYGKYGSYVGPITKGRRDSGIDKRNMHRKMRYGRRRGPAGKKGQQEKGKKGHEGKASHEGQEGHEGNEGSAGKAGNARKAGKQVRGHVLGRPPDDDSRQPKYGRRRGPAGKKGQQGKGKEGHDGKASNEGNEGNDGNEGSAGKAGKEGKAGKHVRDIRVGLRYDGYAWVPGRPPEELTSDFLNIPTRGWSRVHSISSLRRERRNVRRPTRDGVAAKARGEVVFTADDLLARLLCVPTTF